MNILKLGAAALGLSCVAVPASAAVHSIAFTAEGVASSYLFCIQGDCDLTGYADNTPWKFTFEWLLDTPMPNSFSGGYSLHSAGISTSFEFPAPHPILRETPSDAVVTFDVIRGSIQSFSFAIPHDQGWAGINITDETAFLYETYFGYDFGDGWGEFNTFGDGRITSMEVAGPIPEPATWAMMIAGFGLVGMTARRTNRNLTRQSDAHDGPTR